MNKHIKQLLGIEKQWGKSIAVKITAPILWVILAVGILIAVLLQQNFAEDVADDLNLTIDYLSFQLQERLNKTDGTISAEDRLWVRERIRETDIDAITIVKNDTLIVFGQSSRESAEIVREIIFKGNNDHVKVIFKHPPMAELVAQNRRELLVNFGMPILLFAFILAGIIHYILMRPITELMMAIKLVAEGDLTKRIKSKRNDEFGHLGKFFDVMLDELQDQQRELEAAVKTAEDASSAKSSFLANMSHEIRTPLTAIIGFSEILRDGGLTKAEQEKEVASIISGGIHLQQIINNILDLSKIEAGQLDVDWVEVNPFDIMEDIKILFSSKAMEKGINFSVEYGYPFPNKILTDPTRLKQIIVNLCSNAIKFTHEGSVSLLATYNKSDNRLLISVSDTGLGISEEDQQHIFSVFTQADTSITREYGGTGLGLAISKELVELLNGEILCSSKKGLGSEFRIEIDVGAVARDNLVDSPARELQQVSGNGKQEKSKYLGRILLAEDNEENRRLLGFYLKRAGVDFIAVEDGAKAVQCALAEKIDLIFMDMQMPVMDGITAIRILRQQEFTGPIVVLTANVLAEDRKACKEAGANEFISKPIDIKRFHSVLNQYLEKAAAR